MKHCTVCSAATWRQPRCAASIRCRGSRGAQLRRTVATESRSHCSARGCSSARGVPRLRVAKAAVAKAKLWRGMQLQRSCCRRSPRATSKPRAHKTSRRFCMRAFKNIFFSLFSHCFSRVFINDCRYLPYPSRGSPRRQIVAWANVSSCVPYHTYCEVVVRPNHREAV